MEPFHQIRRRAGYADVKTCAEFLGVTPKTVKTWDAKGAPLHVTKFMQLTCQELDWIDPAWRGFFFHGPELLGPSGEHITPGDIRAYPYLQRALDSFMIEDKKRRAHRQRIAAWWREGLSILKDTFRTARAPRVPRDNSFVSSRLRRADA